jgi:hypothetical protein
MNEPPKEVGGLHPPFCANQVVRNKGKWPSTSPTQAEFYYKCSTIVPYHTMKEMVTVFDR